ncbi:MAG: hypothetical protein CMH81_02695 [Nitrospiraceae bacterium]|nr:hypothetical protein [Nitrospiraceae bacterium]
MEGMAMGSGHRFVLGCVVVFVVLFSLPIGCTSKTDNAESQSNPLVMQGKELFTDYCIHCHGPSGIGDGFNAGNVDPGPRDLTDSETEDGEVGFMASLTNEKIYHEILSRDLLNPDEFEALQEAYLDAVMMEDEEAAKVAEAKLPMLVPPAMPTFKYTLSDAERWALVAYVRTLHKNDAPPVDVPSTVSTVRPTFPKRQAPSWEMAEDERIAIAESGKFIFIDKFNCNGCHVYKTGELGGVVGPDLRRSGERLNLDWTYQWISSPQAMKPDTKMPNLALSEDEAKAITLYLETLKLPATS